MDIKRGCFATLHDGSVYEVVSPRKDKQGNYRLRSTNPDDLNNGFTRYGKEERLFIKDIPGNQIKTIKDIQPYATLKNDSEENKFDIIHQREDLKKNNKLILVSTNRILSEKFNFSPFGYHWDETFAKVVSENEVDIKYIEKDIFVNTPRDAHHSNIETALNPMGKTSASQLLRLTSKEQDPKSFI